MAKLDVATDDATEVFSPDEAISPHEASGLAEGTRLGEYLIGKVVGQGGGGTVYSAQNLTTKQRVAIKVLRAEMVPYPALVTRFIREAEAANKIRHPNIVEIFAFGEVERGRPYYVMELLDGMDLRNLLALHGRFSPREVLDLLDPVCRAVQAAHEAGIIHRDIKANNVLIADVNGERVVKLLDFGIAKMLHGEASGQGLTEPGARLGTAHNMAPEQIRCEKLDARADIYALGVVLYQLLTGEYPFHADDPRRIALMHLQAPPPRPSSRAPVSPAVDAVVLRCLEKQADRRFASMNELLAALRAAVGEPSVSDDRAQSAVGIYCVLETGTENDDEELDDAMFEDISNVLDTVENGLASRDFAFPLRTSNALLGVRVLPTLADSEREHEAAHAVVSELRAILAERPDPHPKLRVVLSLKLGEVLCSSSSAGSEITGGSLLDVGAWADEHRLPDA